MPENSAMFKRYWRELDGPIVLILIIIGIFSTLAVYTTTVNRAGLGQFYIKEMVWQVLSFVVMLVIAFSNYRNLKTNVAWSGYITSIFLLFLVFLFPKVNGAHSWISLFGFQIQPSEFAKLFLILTISNYMEQSKEKGEGFGFKQARFILLLTFIPFILTLIQPALGQALVFLGIIGAMFLLFLEKKAYKIFLWSIGAFVLLIILTKSIFPTETIHFIQGLPFMNHQKERIIVFMDPNADPRGIGFQVNQAITAVGSGNLMGKGFLNGTQTQGQWIPEQWTDFIFSAIAEEFGFFGSSILIFTFFLLIYRLIKIASLVTEYFSVFYITGIIGMFVFQIIENIGMNLGIMPVAGITLPFVSYGGSSLLTNDVLIGIALSIGIRKKKLIF